MVHLVKLRTGSIMRNGKAFDFQITKVLHLAGLNNVFLSQRDLAHFFSHCLPGFSIGINVHAIAPSQNADALNVIAVLMGYKQRFNVLKRAANRLHALF